MSDPDAEREFQIFFAGKEAFKDSIWALVTSILAIVILARATATEGLANIWWSQQIFHVALTIATNLLVIALIARRPSTYAVYRTPLLTCLRIHRIAAMALAVPSYVPPFQRAASPTATSTTLSIAVPLALIGGYHAVFHFAFQLLGAVQAAIGALINVIPVMKSALTVCAAESPEVAALMGGSHAGLAAAIESIAQSILPATWPNTLGKIPYECVRTRVLVLLTFGLFAPLTAAVVLEERARHRFLMCTGQMHLPTRSVRHPLAMLNAAACVALQAWCLWEGMAAIALMSANITF